MVTKKITWTPKQKKEVDNWVDHTVDEIARQINLAAVGIRKLDKRPRKTQPDVYSSYVKQAMLEDLVSELKERCQQPDSF